MLTHKKLTTNVKLPHPSTNKKRKIGTYHCRICMDNFETRQDLFKHQIDSQANPDTVDILEKVSVEFNYIIINSSMLYIKMYITSVTLSVDGFYSVG